LHIGSLILPKVFVPSATRTGLLVRLWRLLVLSLAQSADVIGFEA